MENLKEKLSNILAALLPSSSDNLKVVVLAMVAATTFWFFTALNKNYTTRIDYPISIVFDNDDLIVVKELPRKVTIDVTGGGWNLLRKTIGWNLQPVQIPVDNPLNLKYLKGSSLYPEISEHLKDIKLNYVVTDTFMFDIQRYTSRKLALWVNDTSISLAKDHRITSEIILNPDSVTVEGPEKIVAQLPKRVEVKISKNGISKNYSDNIEILSDRHKLMKVSPKEVEVFFEVSRFINYEFLVPVTQLGFSSQSTYHAPDSVWVQFIIADTDKTKWDPIDFEVVADRRQINRSDSSIALRITKYPTQLKDIKLKSPVVKLIYGRK